MSRLKELTFRTANAGLLASLNWLHRRHGKGTTYKVGNEGIAAQFEGSWFVYHARDFGCTGNLDYVPDAENSTREALFARIKGDEVFYDIGAHGGVYTVTLLKRFPKLQVHSFEPQPEELIENLRLNGLPTARVHAVAVGEKEGHVRMTTKERSSNHVSDKGNREVRMVRLDDLGLPAPHWIKIDIEGLELPALKGAECLLREGRPTIICEINHLHDRFGTTVTDFLNYMAKLGYQLHRLKDGQLEAIGPVKTFADMGFSADWNFWFVPV